MEGPPREQVDSRASESASARATQDETRSPFFDSSVDFVEKDRQPLDLVDHHGSVGREGANFPGEERGVRKEPLVLGLVEKVDGVGIGECVS